MAHLDIGSGTIVANADVNERRTFIRNTYLHLAGAIAIFAVVETFLIQSGIAAGFMRLLGGSAYSWLIVLALFMGVSYIADKWAHSGVSRELQYAGLGLFILAEAIVFMPLIYMALAYTQGNAGNILMGAAAVTLALVAGLTFTAFTTRKDFSFLAPALTIGGFVAIGLIVASILFGFELGMLFFAAMIIFAAGAILYQTSNIIHHYRSDQHVAASLGLFSSVGLMFWYVLQFMMSMTGGD